MIEIVGAAAAIRSGRRDVADTDVGCGDQADQQRAGRPQRIVPPSHRRHPRVEVGRHDPVGTPIINAASSTTATATSRRRGGQAAIRAMATPARCTRAAGKERPKTFIAAKPSATSYTLS